MRLHYGKINAIIRITNKIPGCVNPRCSFQLCRDDCLYGTIC